MGMFDFIKYNMECPMCGKKLDSFQSKEGFCTLSVLEFWEVSNFYDYCDACFAWVEFNRKDFVHPTIEDYVITVEVEKDV